MEYEILDAGQRTAFRHLPSYDVTVACADVVEFLQYGSGRFETAAIACISQINHFQDNM